MYTDPVLRIEMHDSPSIVMIRLEGRFAGEGADQVRTLVTRCPTEGKLVIDLTEVTFVDDVGEGVLSFLKRLGAQFIADTSYTLDFCERLSLPVSSDGKPKTDGSGRSGEQSQNAPHSHRHKRLRPSSSR